MIDITKLKALAEAAPTGPWASENDSLYFKDDGYTRHLLDSDPGSDVEEDAYYAALNFIAAANPAAVLELIGKVESLREVLAATRDARDAKACFVDELQAENDSLRQQLAVPSDVLADCEAMRLENESLRKDAERLEWLDSQYTNVVEGCGEYAELVAIRWSVEGQCSTVRDAIDDARAQEQNQ